MLDTVLRKTGEGVGTAVGSGGETVAGGYINFMLSPYGLVVLVVIFLVVRAIR